MAQTERARDAAAWSVSESRVLDGASESPRLPGLRLRANPYTVDVQLAFDNSRMIRWRSWKLAEPGMFLQVDFGDPQKLMRSWSNVSDEAIRRKSSWKALDPQGKWADILDEPFETGSPTRVNLRGLR